MDVSLSKREPLLLNVIAYRSRQPVKEGRNIDDALRKSDGKSTGWC